MNAQSLWEETTKSGKLKMTKTRFEKAMNRYRRYFIRMGQYIAEERQREIMRLKIHIEEMEEERFKQACSEILLSFWVVAEKMHFEKDADMIKDKINEWEKE